MAVTVKLPVELEQRLRKRSAALGRSASELVREALQTYLGTVPGRGTSAYELGEDLFGRHSAPANLATTRKQSLVHAWTKKHRR